MSAGWWLLAAAAAWWAAWLEEATRNGLGYLAWARRRAEELEAAVWWSDVLARTRRRDRWDRRGRSAARAAHRRAGRRGEGERWAR